MSDSAPSNLSGIPTDSGPETKPNVSWTDPDHRAKGRRMLNNLARSNPAVLRPFEILRNDWEYWWELLDWEERKGISDTTLREIDALLNDKWDETFPSFNHPDVRIMLRDLVGRFLFRDDRDSELYSFWEPRTSVALAVFFWVIRRYPSNEVTYALGAWELDTIHKTMLPFEDRANLNAIISRHEGNIRNVYDRLLQTIDEQGLTVESLLGHLVSPATLAEIKDLHGERTGQTLRQ